ncbi:MAG: RNA-binding cell elongation regulator Jag/EloR, partial [Schaedlerella sp.]|nr:RNA-binding cell elongation regulator Jag/EloR [Schaedlerella sp.]
PAKREHAKKDAAKTLKKEVVKKEAVKEDVVKSEAPKREIATITEESKNAVEIFLADAFKAMNMKVELESKIEEDGSLTVNMEGANMGILIGKRGQTLDSLQYLANRVANKYQDGYVRVKLDTENYRARREETLRHLAKNIAHKVKRSRRAVSLEPMNPYERRIIHSALQSDPYVTTHSEGEEPYRKVVITLKR